MVASAGLTASYPFPFYCGSGKVKSTLSTNLFSLHTALHLCSISASLLALRYSRIIYLTGSIIICIMASCLQGLGKTMRVYLSPLSHTLYNRSRTIVNCEGLDNEHFHYLLLFSLRILIISFELCLCWFM